MTARFVSTARLRKKDAKVHYTKGKRSGMIVAACRQVSLPVAKVTWVETELSCQYCMRIYAYEQGRENLKKVKK